jgi:uncharacterized protein (DUF2236 family)
MGTTAVTQRPAGVVGGRHTKDNGLFGPDSLTWHLHCQPPMLVIGTAAALTQMLHPRVMRMIDQSSSFRAHPELRAKRTGEYILTITYGDVETAETAAAALHRMHERLRAVDPETGESYGVLVPEYLLWVHNTLTWCTVRGFEAYGDALTAAERDQYVREQHIAARLVGCDVSQVASTYDELDDWVRQQLPMLAFTHEAIWFRDLMVPSGIPKGTKAIANRVLARAAVGTMAREHRELYGMVWSRRHDAGYRVAADLMFRGIRSRFPIDALIPGIRAELDVNAFGARHEA